MKIDQAFSFAEELAVLKFFPSQASAMTKIAELIADLCINEAQARKLVDVMCKRFDEWPGPVTLRQVYIENFGGDRMPEWKPSYEPPPPPACTTCSDLGMRKDAQGLYRRCSCVASSYISEQMLTDFNRWQQMHKMPPAGERRKDRVQ